MIDLILQGTKANIATLLRNRNLTDANNNPNEGFEACWWAGDGKFLTAKAVMAGQTVVTPATYLAGFVLLCRIHGARGTGDTIANPADAEQWSRSQIANWIKANGTPGTMGGITYYEVALVRLFRPADVNTWLATNGLPGHQWMGGNNT